MLPLSLYLVFFIFYEHNRILLKTGHTVCFISAYRILRKLFYH